MDINGLFEQQFSKSEYFKKTFDNLKNVITRKIKIEDFYYVLQFNPARIRSTTAKTDAKVDKNTCFLCPDNRFPEQIAMEYNQNYNLLINPFPIFSQHLTIVDKRHTPQTFSGEEIEFLKMAQLLKGSVVFYNAPTCGASAPFHRHFQSGDITQMPVFKQINIFKQKYSLHCYKTDNVEVHKIYDSTRRFIIIETTNLETAAKTITSIENSIKLIYNAHEAEANIGATFLNGKYTITIFPREKHRPSQYFETPPHKITISPGFADMAGIIPCAVESEFHKISDHDIISIFNQVTASEDKFRDIDITNC